MKGNVLLRTNVFICIIIIMGFIITSMVSYHSNKGVLRKDVEDISQLTSEGIYHQIDSLFAKPINISLTMANDSLLKSFLDEEVERKEDGAFIQTMKNYLLSYKEKYDYDSVFLVSTKTNRYYHFDSGVDRVLNKGNPENVWYYTFLDSPKEYDLNIDNDEVSTANNEIAVFVNCKIKDKEGKVAGVVGVGLKVASLQKMFEAYEKNFDIKAYLVDDKGNIEISTDRTGYEKTSLFEDCGFGEYKERMLADRSSDTQSFWYADKGRKGFVLTKYIPGLTWHLIIDNDTTVMESKLNRQFYVGAFVVVLIILLVLVFITSIVRKYNEQIVKLTVEYEKKHRSAFQAETEKIYESIYEIDITHNCAASEATEDYFEELGVPKDTPYDQALPIIAEKQIKEEYRTGYMATFCPGNVLKAFEEGRENLCYDFMISHDGGRTYYWMRITARVFAWEEDQSIHMFIYRQNIDEEKRHEREMIEKMERDSLTGLFNKAATQNYINRQLQEMANREFAFFILDIDNFKNVNDNLGHAAGDEVITEFAEILKNQFHDGDIVGRIGGDEFVVFIPVVSREWVERKAQFLLEVLRHGFAKDNQVCHITASIGVALVPRDGSTFEILYKNADKALYETKKRGKDGVTIF
ncbi:Cyclic di-GMP phosphodiesterase Gmr [uncultured Eubacterium sp.]|nr:Cyclic di-GMP phosphodiesterase Gmr [uncultured Eubacterium sp.]